MKFAPCWAADQKYNTLAYFAQCIEEMLSPAAPDSYRVPALDTYHRCLEIIVYSEEIRGTEVSEKNILSLLEELDWSDSRDPVIKKYFSAEWILVLRNIKDDKAIHQRVNAVKLFERRLGGGTYLERCKALLAEMTVEGKAKNKSEYRTAIENFCSFLISAGFDQEYIHNIVDDQFFKVEFLAEVKEEIQRFLEKFEQILVEHSVLVEVSNDLVQLASTNSMALVSRPQLSPSLKEKFPKLEEAIIKGNLLEFNKVAALDPAGAFDKVEEILEFTRAVAYTVKPTLTLTWNRAPVIVSKRYPHGICPEIPQTHLRRRSELPQAMSEQQLVSRLNLIFHPELSETDRTRVLNSTTTYANAFHSENVASQLVTLWASLEGLLPSPTGGASRIEYFTDIVVACQRRVYIRNQFWWLYRTLSENLGEKFSEAVLGVKDAETDFRKFVYAICFPSNKDALKSLASYCNCSPLATQRLFELQNPAQAGSRNLYSLVEKHAQKIRWHLGRIYRERNRIVHRARPSPSAASLILNLNEYYLNCLDCLFACAADNDLAGSIDDWYWEIRVVEESRRAKSLSEESVILTIENLEDHFRIFST